MLIQNNKVLVYIDSEMLHQNVAGADSAEQGGLHPRVGAGEGAGVPGVVHLPPPRGIHSPHRLRRLLHWQTVRQAFSGPTVPCKSENILLLKI